MQGKQKIEGSKKLNHFLRDTFPTLGATAILAPLMFAQQGNTQLIATNDTSSAASEINVSNLAIPDVSLKHKKNKKLKSNENSNSPRYVSKVAETFTGDEPRIDYTVFPKEQDPKSRVLIAHIVQGVTDRGYFIQAALIQDFRDNKSKIALQVFNSKGYTVWPPNGNVAGAYEISDHIEEEFVDISLDFGPSVHRTYGNGKEKYTGPDTIYVTFNEIRTHKQAVLAFTATDDENGVGSKFIGFNEHDGPMNRKGHWSGLLVEEISYQDKPLDLKPITFNGTNGGLEPSHWVWTDLDLYDRATSFDPDKLNNVRKPTKAYTESIYVSLAKTDKKEENIGGSTVKTELRPIPMSGDAHTNVFTVSRNLSKSLRQTSGTDAKIEPEKIQP